MDDNLKIQALMIYYNHWGNDQNKIRKTLDGVKKFQDLYNENGFIMRMSCRSYLKRHKRRTVYHLINVLIGWRCGFEPVEMLPESKDRVGMLLMRTLEKFPLVGNDAYWNIVGVGFSEADALSVDAIIALI